MAGVQKYVHVSGLRGTLAAFRDLPKEASDELRDAAGLIAQDLAGAIASAARSHSRQAALMAPTVKVGRDRVPVVRAGGSRRVGSRAKPAYKILFGSEFGSNRLRQFKPASPSYWMWRTTEEQGGEISRRWLAAADAVVAKFTGAPEGPAGSGSAGG